MELIKIPKQLHKHAYFEAIVDSLNRYVILQNINFLYELISKKFDQKFLFFYIFNNNIRY